MELLINDLSLDGQFHDLNVFMESIRRIMTIRGIMRRTYSRELYCNRTIANSQVNTQLSMRQAMRYFSIDEQRAIMSWLDKAGPFWDEDQQHDSNDWYELPDGTVVTDTAVGEVANCVYVGIDRRLISLKPSDYIHNPIKVNKIIDDDKIEDIYVVNYWNVDDVREALDVAQTPISSWDELRTRSEDHYSELTFVEDAFKPLAKHPFSQSAAETIYQRLNILNQIQMNREENGGFTSEGLKLNTHYFTGGRAWFSDESRTNKHHYRQKLTFPNPDDPNNNLFCPWHGKVSHRCFRIHFSWPVSATNPLYIVYIGPKLTK